MRAVFTLALLTLASCASSAFDRAPMRCETGSGTVRGYAVDDVAEVGRLVRDLSPQVREILRPRQPEPVRVVVMRASVDPFAKAYTQEFVRDGRTVERVIVVGSERPHLRGFMVAHELVHWYADGSWDRLPLALEEGLADLIACQLDPVGREAKLYDLAHVPPAASFEEIKAALRVTRETWAGLTTVERERAYWVGYVIASRIGVEGLRELAEQAVAGGAAFVSVERVLARAGLGTDLQEWSVVPRD
jgi:hypothetical protein